MGVCNPCHKEPSGPLYEGTASFSDQDFHRRLAHRNDSKCADCAVSDQVVCRENLVCGTSLDEMRDPMHNFGPVRTGLIDVNGDGRVNCEDCHDAICLAYPVDHVPHPAHTSQDFMRMQRRNQAVLALEDLAKDKDIQEEEMEEKLCKIAERSGMSVDELRQISMDIHEIEAENSHHDAVSQVTQIINFDPRAGINRVTNSASSTGQMPGSAAQLPGGRVRRESSLTRSPHTNLWKSPPSQRPPELHDPSNIVAF